MPRTAADVWWAAIAALLAYLACVLVFAPALGAVLAGVRP